MNAPTTLATFALALAVVFAGAVGVGAAVGPIGPVAGDPAGDPAGEHTGDVDHAGTEQEQEHP